MHNGPHTSRLPTGVPDEGDLLAWIEGEPLSPEASVAVSRALVADPALARRVELMRADRAALRSLAEERAPGGLIEAVEAAMQPVLERELLLGLQESEPADDQPVVSMVRPEKRGVFQTFLADRAGRRMAMAAGLLVLVGGATWWGTMTLTRGTGPGRTGPSKIGPIAVLDKSATPVESVLSKSGDSEIKTDEASRVAQVTDPSVAAPLAAKIEEPIEPGPEAPEAPVVVAAGEVVGPVQTPMDPALAAELASERKLVIRVVSRDGPRRACDRVRKECNSNAWKLAATVPPELTVALDARPFDLAPPAARPAAEAQAFANDESIQPIMGPPAPREMPVIEETEPQPVYVVQARLDAATLSQLRTSLERGGRGDEVIFEERYEPLPLANNAPVLTPQAALWWTNPPAGWTRWGEVPIVVEPR